MVCDTDAPLYHGKIGEKINSIKPGLCVSKKCCLFSLTTNYTVGMFLSSFYLSQMRYSRDTGNLFVSNVLRSMKI